MRLPTIAFALLALVACDTHGGGGAGSGAPKAAESGTKKGSAGGFSATLSAELAKQNVEPASIAATAPAAGSSAAATSAAGSTATPAGSAAASTASATGSGTASATGSGAASATGSGAASATGSGAVVAMTPTPSTPSTPATQTPASVAAGSAAAAKVGSAQTASTPANQIAQTPSAGAGPTPQNLSRAPMKPSAELAAIKFDLEPNWDRDLGEAGTFSLVVKVPNTNETRVFSVHYGYEDQAAPVDCDSYRKYLEDKKVMTVTLNRQRGAACYIEGDAGRGAVFRYLLTYGGKHLMCNGSLYKDQAALGDLRDKVLMQAKKICETLAL